MRLVWQLLVGVICGFFGAYLFLYIADIELAPYVTHLIIALYVVTFLSFIWSSVLNRQIVHLNKQSFSGEDEDDAETAKYRKFSDYSLLTQSGTVIALVALSLSLITSLQSVFTIIGIIFLFLGSGLQMHMVRLMQKVYPERNLPSASETNYANKLLEATDEGERHIMVQGLYKTHQLLNILLMVAIIIATIYSISSENSQIFSILLMGAVLILTNGRYMLAVRNK